MIPLPEGLPEATINVPARTVIISPWAWKGSRRTGGPFRSPISQSMFEAMAGRAGRMRFADDFGRAILLAHTEFERDRTLRYLVGPCEPVTSRLCEEPVEKPVLAAIASGAGTVEKVAEWLGKTLAGRTCLRADPSRRSEIEEVVHNGIGLGIIARSRDGITLTAAGRAIARSGLDLASVEAFTWWLEAVGNSPSTLDALVLACTIPGAVTVPVPLPASEHRSRNYQERVREQGGVVWQGTGYGRSPRHATYDQARMYKLALALQEWLEGLPVRDLEDGYGMGAGTLSRAGEEAASVLHGLAEFGRETGTPAGVLALLEEVASRLPFGVRQSGMGLARLGVTGLGRDHIHRLVDAGFDDPGSLAGVPPELLAKVVPGPIAKRLITTVHGADPGRTPAAGKPIPDILIVDPSSPGTVRYRGESISLTPMEYRLLLALAQSPSRCVPYENLYRAMWGQEGIGDRNRLLFHRRRLQAKLDAVKTVPGHGLMLALPEEAVVVVSGVPEW